MKTVVVYESMYGNCHRIADIVANTLADLGPTEVVVASEATAAQINGADFVVVGGPTHDHSMSTKRSRGQSREKASADAAKHGVEPPQMDPHWDGPGLREWFRKLPVSPEPIAASGGQFAACFDTRFNARALLTGRAARTIGRSLTRHGFILVAEPESFLVDKDSVLLESEVTRAHHWAKGLVAALQAEETPPLDWMNK